MVGKSRKGVTVAIEKVGSTCGQERTPSPTHSQEKKHVAAAPVEAVDKLRPAPPKPATLAAMRFLEWLREHDLCHEWTVDDVWYLATDDFAEALDVGLPPRRVFLGELQKRAGVHVTYDRRVRDRAGRVLRKTTFYRFTAQEIAAEHLRVRHAA